MANQANQTVLSNDLCQVVLDLYEMEAGIKALTGEKKAVTVGDKEHGNGAIGAFFAQLTVQYKDAELGDPTDKRSTFSVPAYDKHIAMAEANVRDYARAKQGATTGADFVVHYPKCWGQYISDCRRFIGLGVAKEVYAKDNKPLGILKIKTLGLEAKANAAAKDSPWLAAKLILADAVSSIHWFDKAQPGETHTSLTARRESLIHAIIELSSDVANVKALRSEVKEIQANPAIVAQAVAPNVPPVVDGAPVARTPRRRTQQAVAEAA